MRWQAKDPASCYSHLLGVALSLAGLVTLLVESQGDPWRVVGFSTYGASLVLLYSASTISSVAVTRKRRSVASEPLDDRLFVFSLRLQRAA